MLTSECLHGFEEGRFSARVKKCAMELARQGGAALAELFDLVGLRSVRYARALTRNQHDAEDALQAAFVRVALYPQGLADADHPWAYLLRIVRNEALKIIQKKRADEWLVAGEPKNGPNRRRIGFRSPAARPAGARKTSLQPVGSGGPEDLGGDDVCRNRRSAGGIAEHRRQPLSIRFAKVDTIFAAAG